MGILSHTTTPPRQWVRIAFVALASGALILTTSVPPARATELPGVVKADTPNGEDKGEGDKDKGDGKSNGNGNGNSNGKGSGESNGNSSGNGVGGSNSGGSGTGNENGNENGNSNGNHNGGSNGNGNSNGNSNTGSSGSNGNTNNGVNGNGSGSGSSTPAPPAKPKIAHDLDHYDPAAPVTVILQLNGAASQALLAKIQSKGGVVKRHLSSGRAIELVLAAKEIEALAADPGVAYVSPDRRVTAAAVENTRLRRGNNQCSHGVAKRSYRSECGHRRDRQWGRRAP